LKGKMRISATKGSAIHPVSYVGEGKMP
jgi:hypothetical protein